MYQVHRFLKALFTLPSVQCQTDKSRRKLCFGAASQWDINLRAAVFTFPLCRVHLVLDAGASQCVAFRKLTEHTQHVCHLRQ